MTLRHRAALVPTPWTNSAGGAVADVDVAEVGVRGADGAAVGVEGGEGHGASQVASVG